MIRHDWLFKANRDTAVCGLAEITEILDISARNVGIIAIKYELHLNRLRFVRSLWTDLILAIGLSSTFCSHMNLQSLARPS